MNLKITFLDLDKTLTICAPNLPLAEEWAVLQLKHWGRESQFSVKVADETDS